MKFIGKIATVLLHAQVWNILQTMDGHWKIFCVHLGPHLCTFGDKIIAFNEMNLLEKRMSCFS